MTTKTLSHAARQTLLRNGCNICRVLFPSRLSLPAPPGEGKNGEVKVPYSSKAGSVFREAKTVALQELIEHRLVFRGGKKNRLYFTERGRKWVRRMRPVLFRVRALHSGVNALWQPVPPGAQRSLPAKWILQQLAVEVLQGKLKTDDDIRARSRELEFGGEAAL